MGGDGDQAAQAVAERGDGALIAGYTQPPETDRDAWVAGLTPDGALEWTQALGDIDNESIHDVEKLDDGYVVAGYTETLTGHDFWAARIRNDGSPVWTKSYGRSRNDRAHAVTATPRGYVLAGTTKGEERTKAWVVALQPDGSMRWAEVHGLDANYPRSVTTADDGYLVAGYRELRTSPTPDLWLLKLNGSGEEAWNRYTWTGHREARDVLRRDDGYLVAGYTNRGETDDFWLVKTDREGEEAWSRTYGTSDYEFGTGLAELPGTGYVLAGYRGEEDPDFWVVGTDYTGDKLWGRSVTDGNNSSVTGVAATEYGFAVSGYAETDDDLDARVVAYNYTTRERSRPQPDIRVTPTKPRAGERVRFNASPVDAAEYTWSFGDGGTANGRNASHVYGSSGNYTVTLQVRDGVTSSTARTVRVHPTDSDGASGDPPRIHRSPADPVVGEEVLLRVGGEANWSFGDGGSAWGGEVTHTYSEPGTYTVTAEINGSTAKTTITVQEEQGNGPEVHYSPEEPSAGEPVHFNASLMTEAEYTWRFGDGASATGRNATHTYTEPGTYTASLTASTDTRTVNESVTVNVSGDRDTPGFGVATGLLALLGLLLVYTRLVKPT